MKSITTSAGYFSPMTTLLFLTCLFSSFFCESFAFATSFAICSRTAPAPLPARPQVRGLGCFSWCAWSSKVADPHVSSAATPSAFLYFALLAVAFTSSPRSEVRRTSVAGSTKASFLIAATSSDHGESSSSSNLVSSSSSSLSSRPIPSANTASSIAKAPKWPNPSFRRTRISFTSCQSALPSYSAAGNMKVRLFCAKFATFS
mmetsp:Transcript_23406/g.46544  ORF Transcript_23406/g.46544 Transcript_23406/m.46544 type:complete len:203 (-) Transcript_23406:797-1405(-)